MVWKRIKGLIGIGKKEHSSNTSEPSAPASQVSRLPRGGVAPPQSSPKPGGADAQSLQIPSVKSTENPWGVPLLDVRPVTLTMLSTSRDPQCATNAISFGNDDGTSFISQEPKVARSIPTRLGFPIDRMLADGVLFAPRQMEHKWAIFYHRRQIICVRSWLRQVVVVAEVEEREGYVEVTQIRGTWIDENERPAFTERTLDFLLRSHALEVPYPAPLLPDADQRPQVAANWCFSMFGNRVWFATAHEFPRSTPEKPLRTHSLLHIAVARGDVDAIKASLAAGVPIDLLAGDGLAPLHWALASTNPLIMGLLLQSGSSIDVRSAEGATPLMNAAQGAALEKAAFLLDKGADPNARDRRGFTALHRAAEMGHLDIAKMLLNRGASPDADAEGHTPRSLAAKQNRADVLALLNTFGSA
jgi:hypothetical protein